MVGVCGEGLISSACRLFHARIERRICAPEARPSQRFHSRSKSRGCDPSRADSFKNASSFGRAFGSAMICSHRPSLCCASRKRAKFATSTRLASGSCSQMLRSSWVSPLIPKFYPELDKRSRRNVPPGSASPRVPATSLAFSSCFCGKGSGKYSSSNAPCQFQAISVATRLRASRCRCAHWALREFAFCGTD